VTFSNPKKEEAMKVLVVDDSREIAFVVREMLQHEGFQVQIAGNGMAALMSYLRFHPDLVVTDLCMPHMDGFELIEAIRAKNPAVKTVYMSADPDRFLKKLKAEAALEGIDWLSKPFTREDLLQAIAHVCETEMRET
jgi:CheY-like chemotaxis protein